MWLLGLVLLFVGLAIGSSILFWLGIILLVVGVLVYFVPSRHDARRWYW